MNMKKIMILVAMLVLASCTNTTTNTPDAETAVNTEVTTTTTTETTATPSETVATSETATTETTAQPVAPAEPSVPAPVVPEDKSDYPIQKGNTIAVHYTLSLADGVKKESSLDGDKPFEFVIGQGQVIKWWDEGLIGMKIGDTKKLEIEPADAYGEYDETRVQTVAKTELKQFEEAGIKLEVGELLPTQFGNFKIKEATDTSVTVDVNHELAGQKLFFDIEIIDIK